MENNFLSSHSFLFLLNVCEVRKRIKKKRQKKAFEKSLKVLGSKSCNFWVGKGSPFTGHEVLCVLGAAVHKHRALANAAQTDCHQREAGKAIHWLISVD